MDEKSRLRRHLVTYLCVLAAGAVYFIWLKLTGVGIPCVFREFTGWSCPGCGVTTLIMSIAAGRFDLAKAANPFLYYTWPLIPGFLIWNEVKVIKGKTYKADKMINILLLIYVISFIAFGVLRNRGVSPHFVFTGASLHWLPGMIERYLP